MLKFHYDLDFAAMQLKYINLNNNLFYNYAFYCYLVGGGRRWIKLNSSWKSINSHNHIYERTHLSHYSSESLKVHTLSFFYTVIRADCGQPSSPPDGYIITPYTSAAGGQRKLIFVCQNISQNGIRTAAPERLYSAVCNVHGNWEPDPSNFCSGTSKG